MSSLLALPLETLFKFIVKVPVVGNTADTPNPSGLLPFLKEIWESSRVVRGSTTIYLALETPSHKIQVAFFKRQGWGYATRRSKRKECKPATECDSLLGLVVALCEQLNIQNTLFYEEICGKSHALHVHLTYKLRCPSFPKRDGPRIILLKSLPNKRMFCLRYKKLSDLRDYTEKKNLETKYE